jgi:hypothetical protein
MTVFCLMSYQSWIAHIETKIHHFEAAAQYRMSMGEGEANRSESTHILL